MSETLPKLIPCCFDNNAIFRLSFNANQKITAEEVVAKLLERKLIKSSKHHEDFIVKSEGVIEDNHGAKNFYFVILNDYGTTGKKASDIEALYIYERTMCLTKLLKNPDAVRYYIRRLVYDKERKQLFIDKLMDTPENFKDKTNFSIPHFVSYENNQQPFTWKKFYRVRDIIEELKKGDKKCGINKNAFYQIKIYGDENDVKAHQIS